MEKRTSGWMAIQPVSAPLRLFRGIKRSWKTAPPEKPGLMPREGSLVDTPSKPDMLAPAVTPRLKLTFFCLV